MPASRRSRVTAKFASPMNNSRSFLLLALLFVGYLIWNQWQQDYAHPAPAADAPVASAPVAGAANDTPTAPAMPAGSAVPAVPASAAAPASSAALVHVRTDVLDLAIDPHGGSIVRAELLAYPQQPKQFDRPVRLLDDAGASYFVAQSGLVSNTGKAITVPSSAAIRAAPAKAISAPAPMQAP